MTDIVSKVQKNFRESSSMIKHSTPLTYYSEGQQLDLRDVILAGAISGRNVLLNGGTGTAKTHLSLLTLASLFGDDYSILQIDPGINEEKLYNIDFGAVRDGKSLTDLFIKSPLITAPGVLLDEVNRAPPAILNYLQAYLNNQATTPGGGSVQPTGVDLGDGLRYQFKIGTCNEGKQYTGSTWKMDPAFRRRFSIEIPVNLFPPTSNDNKYRVQESMHTGVPVLSSKGNLDDVLRLHETIKHINLHPLASEFILYLGRMNNCIKSAYKTKEEEGFSVERCEGCHARGLAGQENFCGNVYSPPPATQNDLKAVSQAFALLRAQYSETKEKDIEVTLADTMQAFPLVTATKLGFDPAWVKKNFESGEAHQAARAVVTNLDQRIRQKITKVGKYMTKLTITPDDREALISYSDEDPWSTGLRDIDYL